MNRIDPTLALSFALGLVALPAAAQDSVAVAEGVSIGANPGSGGKDRGVSRASEAGHALLCEHVVTPTAPGRSRLVFVLHRWVNDSADPASLSDFGARSFVDEYLLEELGDGARRGLSGVTIVDRVVHRATESSRRVEFEHAIELDGPDALVNSALDWLQRFVAKNRGTVTMRMTVATRLVEGGGPGGAAGDGAPRVALLDAAGGAALATSLTDREGSDVLLAPTITLRGGQRGTVQATSQTSYLADFDVTIAQGQMIATPIVKVFTDGLTWEVAAILDPDDDAIVLDTRAIVTSLRRPMRDIETRLAPDTNTVTIQLPEFDEARWESTGIELTSRERAIHVSGLRFTTWDESGLPRLEEIELLITIEGIAPDSPRPNSETIGIVLGVDGSTGRVFLKRDGGVGSDSGPPARRIVLERDGRQVGECSLVEAIDGVLVLRLERGEARAGDRAR